MSFDKNSVSMLHEVGRLEAFEIKRPQPQTSQNSAIPFRSNLPSLQSLPDLVKISQMEQWFVVLTFRNAAEYKVSIQNSRMVYNPDTVVFEKGDTFIELPRSAFRDQAEIALLSKYTIKKGVWKVYKPVKYVDSRKSIVIAAHRETGDRVVAKRMSKREKNQSPENILCEIENLQAMGKCTNAVQFIEAFECPDEVTLVMEYFSTITITDLINQRDLSEKQAVDIIVQLLEFVVEANLLGYAHRDLKPDNILVKELKKEMAYKVKVIDFGLAQNMSVPLEKRINKFCGTIGFAAPEIFKGADYGMNVDVFSLGCVFYSLLTKKLLFSNRKEESSTKEANKECNIDKQMAKAKFLFSSETCGVLAGMLAKEPNKRISALCALEALLKKGKNSDLPKCDSSDYEESMEEGARNNLT
jgi:serine/threonine protein kinase